MIGGFAMPRRSMIVFLILLLVAAALVVPGFAAEPAGAKIRFGALPVLQALPLFVAQEKGLFGKAGVDVDLVPFNTAAEKDIALTAGSIDGCFADLFTPLVLAGNGVGILIVATNYDTRQDRRMFAVLGKPGGKYKTVKDLAQVPVAVSSNSVIDYVTESLLVAGGVPKKEIATVESKNIGLRMQMLLTGKVEAATLPEPLVTAAVAKGAVLLADDKGLEASQTVLVFGRDFAEKNPSAVKRFLAAVREANTLINGKPDEVRGIMVKNVRLPGPLKERYPVPGFPDLHSPDAKTFDQVLKWLESRMTFRNPITYRDVVDGKYLQAAH
jgi:NitT/TauT family transport system substrate-binding protein